MAEPQQDIPPRSAAPGGPEVGGGTIRGLRLIAALVATHRGPFAVAVTGSALFAGASVLSAAVLGRVTDEVVVPTFADGTVPPGSLPWAVAAVVAVAVLVAVGVILRRYFAGVTSERTQVTLRHRLVDQYLDLPLAWHQRTPTGRLLSHADSDTEMVAEALGPLPFSLGVAFLALFSAVSLVLVDPVLAAVALLIFPALTVLNRIYSRQVEGPAAAIQEDLGRVAAIAHESFDGALVVKTLGRAEAERQRFSAAVDQLRADRLQMGYIRAVFDAVMDALPNLGVVAVVLVGAIRIDAGAMTRGDLIQVAALFGVLALPMRVFGFFLEMVPLSLASHDRLAAVFALPVPPGPAPAHRLPPGPLALSATGLTFAYDPPESIDDTPTSNGSTSPTGSTGAAGPSGPNGAASPTGSTGAAGPPGPNGAASPTGSTGAAGPSSPKGATSATGSMGTAGPSGPMGAGGLAGGPGLSAPPGAEAGAGQQPVVLDGVELALSPGEVVALVGATGSGKTTLVTLLAGLVPPGRGVITIGGVPVDAIDPMERAAAVAVVFQESFLFADTVRANVDLAGRAGDDEIYAALAVAHADGFVAGLPLGLDTVLGERGVTLSGGQRQRIALARALLGRPRLLFLDDATSAVDAVVEQRILAGLRADRWDGESPPPDQTGPIQPTVLIVAQRVSTIELADRVLYLAGGRIEAAGSHRQLLALPGYEALVRAYEEVAR